MKILENYSLKEYNSFAVAAMASSFVKVTTVAELQEAVQVPVSPKLVLGGGSNILFVNSYPGLVIYNGILGIEVSEETSNAVILKVGGGVIWHELVLWTLARDYGGIENLSLIPGTVGAAPIQNIGAYGVEFAQVFVRLHAVEIETGRTKIFEKEDCDFGYRNSIFKQTWKGKFAIHQVEIKLTKNQHDINTSYGSIESELDGLDAPTIQDVSQAVIAIRQSKLPDPGQLGNAGSFFKNPIIHQDHFTSLRMDYPDMPFYTAGEDLVKIPAAWLIESCGWKGFRKDDAGIYSNHALVLVNHGHATGQQIHQLAHAIQASVREVYQIELVPEVNIL